jgi:hypothetical protein
MSSIVEHHYIGSKLVMARNYSYEPDFPSHALRDWQFEKDNPVQCPACHSADVYGLISSYTDHTHFELLDAGWWCHECKLVWGWIYATCLTCGRSLNKQDSLLVCPWCGEQWEEATILSAFNNEDEWSEVNMSTKRKGE